ncbi:MAG: sulfurtransferase [Actinomycetota bacterium]|nr:sulfurtransferase [Actinomycetota bacterium]
MLVETGWLADRLDDPDVVLVDMRWREDGSGHARYERGHIPGAVFLDWSIDLVDPDHPVAFMLAPPDRFARVMERRGIGDGSLVVAYADAHGSGPFRLWWACRVYGHDNVRVLDGGLRKWIAEGRPLSTESPRPRPVRWTPRFEPGWQAGSADVAGAAGREDVMVLDSRPPEQFRGEAVWFETGPVAADPDGFARTPRGRIRAGRVPWAASLPAASLYREDDTLKSPQELRELLGGAGVRPEARAITYCGVGISASALAFALKLAGVKRVSLYDASWEEWGRDPDRPIARG